MRYAYPVIANVAVSAITAEHILAVLRSQWEERTETLMRVRNRIERVLGWAEGVKLRTGDNPARWNGMFDAYLNKKARKETRHFAALRYQDIPALVAELAARGSPSADALIYCILTGARTNEVRLARWSEIDISAQLWTLPAERMKKAREHRVPLADATMELLRRQPTFPTTGASDGYVFTGYTVGKPMTERTMLDLLKKLRPGVTVHGTVRASLESWGSEMTSFSAEVRQLALAHAVGDKTKQAYHRVDLLAPRRQYAAAWAEFCMSPYSDKVTPLHRVA